MNILGVGGVGVLALAMRRGSSGGSMAPLGRGAVSALVLTVHIASLRYNVATPVNINGAMVGVKRDTLVSLVNMFPSGGRGPVWGWTGPSWYLCCVYGLC